MDADDRPDWQQFEQERPLREFLDAVDTVALFIGGDEGKRIRAALLTLGDCPEMPPPEQACINFDTSYLTY